MRHTQTWTFNSTTRNIIKVFDADGDIVATFCRNNVEEAFRFFLIGARVDGQTIVKHAKTGVILCDCGRLRLEEIDAFLVEVTRS